MWALALRGNAIICYWGVYGVFFACGLALGYRRFFETSRAVFDPEEGTVKYGDVITNYYGEIIGKLNDGTIPEEYREYLEQYFDIIYIFLDR